jgi:hypothetical protein
MLINSSKPIFPSIWPNVPCPLGFTSYQNPLYFTFPALPHFPMNKDEQLARLLRLKRHEKPDEEYFETFLENFHAYQRKAITTQSAASLFLERVGTVCSALRRPATAWAAVAAYAGIMILLHLWPAPPQSATTVLISNQVASQPRLQGAPLPPGSNSPPAWQVTVPAGQTMNASDGPPPLTPPPGKPRTTEQKQHQTDGAERSTVPTVIPR